MDEKLSWNLSLRGCTLYTRVCVAFLACLIVRGTSPPPISPSKTSLWGPGLHRETTSLAINYFYIQARDSLGER